MTALEIINTIIDWGKDATYNEVADLIDGKAAFCDLGLIKSSLYDHVSSNEMNAARYAVMHLS